MSSYPETPGFKLRGYPELSSSQQAAISLLGLAPSIRARILHLMRTRYVSAPDEAAQALHLSVLSVRPRFTELVHMGLIRYIHTHRPSLSGRPQRVYTITAKGKAYDLD